MRLARRLPPAALLVAAVTLGCGDDGTGPGVNLADLVGTWTATQFEFTNRADRSQKVDIIPQGGALTFTILPDGRYIFDLQLPFPGVAPERSRGQVRVQGNRIVLDDNNPEVPDLDGTVSLSGDILTVTADNVPFDFDLDGTNELASIVLVLRRTATGSSAATR